jgi:N-acetylmuramoyl-L-alanine amidase
MALAGCSTVPSPPPETVIVPEQQVVIAEPTPIAQAPVTVAAPVPSPAPITVPAPAPVPAITPAAPTNRITETWISLERWSQLNGLAQPRRLTWDAFPSYSLAASNGVMSIRVGSQLAYWNGLEYRLGFAPQLVNGHPYIHSLDMRKNVEPLFSNAAFYWKTNRVIVIDPGHGGMDTGTKSVHDGHFEKEYTLDWAYRLRYMLATNGWTVFLTRSNDVNLALSNRVAIAEHYKADLFLSLHFNSSLPDHSQSGLETYCLTPTGMPSNLTRGFADNVALTFPNNSFDRENLLYAVRLHRALLKVNGHADRGVRRARFLGVLQNQNRPALLVEGGYLSNSQEAKNIADPAYRQKLAEAIAQALFEEPEVKMNLVSQTASQATPSTNQAVGKIN